MLRWTTRQSSLESSATDWRSISGAGPAASGKFNDGETECPIGHALVRAAVDWRRAGLARLIPFDVLVQALPIYLEDRDDVPRDADAIEAGLAWAKDKIDETVALLLEHNRPQLTNARMFEAFDYLVDEADEFETPVPLAMWQLVRSQANRNELRDIARAAFTGRSEVMAELLAWVGQTERGAGRLLVLTGGPGVGKSAVLGRLVALSDPALRHGESDEITSGFGVPMGSIEVVSVNARGRTANEILAAIVTRAGLDQPRDVMPYERRLQEFLRAVYRDNRVLTLVVDALDEAIKP